MYTYYCNNKFNQILINYFFPHVYFLSRNRQVPLVNSSNKWGGLLAPMLVAVWKNQHALNMLLSLYGVRSFVRCTSCLNVDGHFCLRTHCLLHECPMWHASAANIVHQDISAHRGLTARATLIPIGTGEREHWSVAEETVVAVAGVETTQSCQPFYKTKI